MRELFKSKNFRIAILCALDCIGVILCSLVSLVLRFDIHYIEEPYLDYVKLSFVFYCLIVVVVMRLFRLYNRIWSFASAREFYDICKSTAVIEALIIFYHIFTQRDMPRSYYPLMFVLMLGYFLCERFGLVAIRNLENKSKKKVPRRRIMVVGAGAAGSLLIKDIGRTEKDAVVVCAIDDNKNKRNKYIEGVQVVGDTSEIDRYANLYNITDIIIAMPSEETETIKKVVEKCQSTGKQIKILPSVTRSLTESLGDKVRNINYTDLLGRDPIKINHRGIGEFLGDKVVMVTGGGGSIGSELCRQIIEYNPKKLIIFDIYENNAYEIQMELERHYPMANISTLIGSIRDKERLEAVFAKYRPNIVFHAAAHKHVPLMEKSPNEAIKNNCLGTLNLAQLSDEYKVDNFVLISTDKAVRPTNIMGATKRICEMIVQTYARKSVHTQFSAVRFGNVLGSNGSVIPLFLKQIEEGGPVTVTHKNITRFFMTIPEAVSLVLQASLFAKGGEIFVLNMGKPVKIYELAENLIKLKGLVPGEDIQIEIVGLRPGEKLYEEVLMDEEGLDSTENNMIFVGKPIKMDDDIFLEKLSKLIDKAMENGRGIKELTEEVCTTYTITDN